MYISQGAKTVETYTVILEFGRQDVLTVLAKHSSICLKAKTSAPASGAHHLFHHNDKLHTPNVTRRFVPMTNYEVVPACGAVLDLEIVPFTIPRPVNSADSDVAIINPTIDLNVSRSR